MELRTFACQEPPTIMEKEPVSGRRAEASSPTTTTTPLWFRHPGPALVPISPELAWARWRKRRNCSMRLFMAWSSYHLVTQFSIFLTFDYVTSPPRGRYQITCFFKDLNFVAWGSGVCTEIGVRKPSPPNYTSRAIPFVLRLLSPMCRCGKDSNFTRKAVSVPCWHENRTAGWLITTMALLIMVGRPYSSVWSVLGVAFVLPASLGMNSHEQILHHMNQRMMIDVLEWRSLKPCPLRCGETAPFWILSSRTWYVCIAWSNLSPSLGASSSQPRTLSLSSGECRNVQVFISGVSSVLFFWLAVLQLQTLVRSLSTLNFCIVFLLNISSSFKDWNQFHTPVF